MKIIIAAVIIAIGIALQPFVSQVAGEEYERFRKEAKVVKFMRNICADRYGVQGEYLKEGFCPSKEYLEELGVDREMLIKRVITTLLEECEMNSRGQWHEEYCY